jgi:hypothetical protein
VDEIFLNVDEIFSSTVKPEGWQMKQFKIKKLRIKKTIG